MDELPSLEHAREAFRFENLLDQNQPQRSKEAAATQFGDVLSKTIEELDELNRASDDAFEGLLSGKEDNIHSVMIRMNEADLAMRFALEVRNRLLEAYQEIQRMPI